MNVILKVCWIGIMICLSQTVIGQKELEKIFQGNRNFEQICQDAETYFKEKHIGKSLNDLTQGEFRDGKYVKYCRWKNFWKDHLNSDGTLGDISKHTRLKKDQLSRQNIDNPYQDETWTNISNSNYITGQISLGRTTSLDFHPTDANTFYVGAAIGGIWKTTDGGNTYVPLGDELPYLAVSSIVVDQDNPDKIYIAISDHVWYGPSSIGVYKTEDGGLTWNETALSFEFSENIRIYWMTADPNNADRMYISTAGGLFETTDGFNTVDQINSLDCSEIHFKPNDSNVIYLGLRNGEFYRSTDGGANFDFVTDFGNNYLRLAVTDTDNDLLYISHGNELHKSTDEGATFPTTEDLPESNMVTSFSPLNNNELLVGNFEIYQSSNGGTDFNAITHWLGNGGLPLIHVDQRNIFTNPLQSELIYFCNDGGVYTYNVNTDEFTDLSNGLEITQYYDIGTSQSNSNVVSGGSQDNGSMYRNDATNWLELAPTGDGMNTEIDPSDENKIYWEYQNGGMRRFDGSGNTNISPPGENGNGAWETPYRLDPSNNDRLICGYTKVYESMDQGDNWTAISDDLAGGSKLNLIAIAKSNGDRIYAVQGSTIYVKDVNDGSWDAKSGPAGSITDIEVDPDDMDKIVIAHGGYSNGQKIYESTDAGDSWTNISGSLPNVPVGAIEIYEDVDDAYFIGTDLGVYYRDYQVQDWLEYGSLPHTRVSDVEIQYSDQLLRIGTHGRGVFEANIAIVECAAGDPDEDGDGVCDTYDLCPFLDDDLVGSDCDDGDPNSTGEYYSENCLCENGMSNIVTCDAAGSNGTGSDYITNVSLNDLNNDSGKTGYSDFRNISTTLYEDSTYTLSFRLGYAFPDDEAFAWIDYDQDGTFESNEEIIMSDFDANHTSEGTFTLPSLSNVGATTMRVRNIYGQPGNNDPCNDYFGEVEDYTIQLRDACPFDESISKYSYCPPDPFKIQAQNVLSIDSIIVHSNTIIDFEAGQCIELEAGVDIKVGSTVEITIDDCSNP